MGRLHKNYLSDPQYYLVKVYQVVSILSWNTNGVVANLIFETNESQCAIENFRMKHYDDGNKSCECNIVLVLSLEFIEKQRQVARWRIASYMM